jgi:hypothetical protein
MRIISDGTRKEENQKIGATLAVYKHLLIIFLLFLSLSKVYLESIFYPWAVLYERFTFF